MITRPTLFFIIFLTITQLSYTQNKRDSLKLIWQNKNEVDSLRFNAIIKYYKLYSYSEPDSVLVVTNYHYELAKEKGSTIDMIHALSGKGKIFYIKDRISECMDLLNQSVILASKLDDPVLLARIKTNIGLLYLRQFKFQEAIRYLSDALKVFQNQKLESDEASVLSDLATIYYNLGDYDLCYEYTNKALTIFKKLELKGSQGFCYIDLGLVNYERKNYTESIKNAELALQCYKSVNNVFNQSHAYYLLAMSYEKLNNIDKAFFYANKSLDIDKKIKNEPLIILRLALIANLTFETDIEKATKQGEAILKRLNPDIDHSTKEKVYNLLYKCYKAQNKMDASLKMHELYLTHHDSLQMQKKKFTAIREAVKSEFEVKLHENKIENEKTATKNELKYLTRMQYTIIFFLAIFMILFIYVRHLIKRNKSNKNSLLKEIESLKNNEKSKIVFQFNTFTLNRLKIEESINRTLNETDWKLLNILLGNPEITNKKIAEKAFMSIDGIGSSLRRMYNYFSIKSTKYKKIALLKDVIKRSNQ